MTDNLIFKTGPSTLTLIGWVILFIGMVFTIPPVAILPLIALIYKWVEIKCWGYNLNEMTISEKKGIFNTSLQEIHYYRIKSITVDQPFFLRIFGLSTITIMTTDPSTPLMTLYAVEYGEEIRGAIKEETVRWRKEMKVRNFELSNL